MAKNGAIIARIRPIGYVHSSYRTKLDAPYQGGEMPSEIIIYPDYAGGLKDIEGFSHLHVFYWLHEAVEPTLLVQTPWDDTRHGLFSTRSPNRINPIGYAVVLLVKREENILTVKNLDAIDRTPVLDIKPYIPGIDARSSVKIGWLEKDAGSIFSRVGQSRGGAGRARAKRMNKDATKGSSGNDHGKK